MCVCVRLSVSGLINCVEIPNLGPILQINPEFLLNKPGAIVRRMVEWINELKDEYWGYG